MTFKLILTLVLLVSAGVSHAQDSSRSAKKNERANIVIIARDGQSIKGNVVQITLDYILLDAKPRNSPANLLAYYLRPAGNYYKIDVGYIQAAVVQAKKKMSSSVAAGGISGAMVGSKVAEGPDASTADAAIATGAGMAIGSLVGVAKGLGRKKVVVPVYGQSENLMMLLNYYL